MERRSFFQTVTMGFGLILAYGTFLFQSIAFLIPKSTSGNFKKIFAGTLNSFPLNKIKKFKDPYGNDVLVKRTKKDIKAFSSVCPHLGCKVHWEEEKNRFFCPCHGGAFNNDGVATKGPPFDDKQNLIEVPLEVDNESGIIYVKVRKANV